LPREPGSWNQMKPTTFMLIAGETSGDLLASELVSALKEKAPGATFFGAGGSKMAEAGVELAFDMTQHAVIGISDVLKNYFKFQRLFDQLAALAIKRKPDVIIGVDFGGFNLRFGHAIREYSRYDSSDWYPKIVQFVSPQVWASRAGRADLLARDYDLLLSIFPFEKDWYANRVPRLKVEFVGNPMVERLQFKVQSSKFKVSENPEVLLLPGSRKSELQRHLPVMLPALELIRKKLPGAKAKMILPNVGLQQLAGKLGAEVEIQIGGLPAALAQADVAVASTGTVTMECAFFGVPTVTLYRTSWLTYEIGKRIVTVNSLTMPNLMTGREVYPEFIQDTATPENIARATLELLQDEARRKAIQSQLAKIIASLGGPGAAKRAADAVLNLFRA
jgi:lipid-A-disaccharide synthase